MATTVNQIFLILPRIFSDCFGKVSARQINAHRVGTKAKASLFEGLVVSDKFNNIDQYLSCYPVYAVKCSKKCAV